MNRHVIWKWIVMLAAMATAMSQLTAKEIEIEDGTWTAVGPAQYDCRANDMARGPDGLIYFAPAGGLCGSVRIEDIAVYDPSTGMFESLSPVTVSTNGTIRRIEISNSGALYAAGLFTEIAGVAANGIAKYSNGQWSALGSGLEWDSSTGGINALQIIGNTVFVGGRDLISAGGNPVFGLAQWDGNSWNDVGGGVDGQVWAFANREGSLVVGGNFNAAGPTDANNIAIWDGNAWSTLAEINVSIPTIRAIEVTSAGIVAAGIGVFDIQAQLAAVARWDGSWTPLVSPDRNPTGLGNVTGAGLCNESDSRFKIDSIINHDGKLILSGCFGLNGTPTLVASWSSERWNPLVIGCASLCSSSSFRSFFDINLLRIGNELLVSKRGGSLQADGWVSANLRLTRQGWEPLFSGNALAMGLSTKGLGAAIPLLTASDDFVYSAADDLAGRKRAGFPRWNIQEERWEMLGRVPQPLDLGGFPYVTATTTDPEGNLYFIGRLYKYLDGITDQSAFSVAKWDGSQFQILASDVSGSGFKLQYANGLLFLAGDFSSIDGLAVGNIATWNGASWQPFVSPPAQSSRGIRQFVAQGDQLFIAAEFENQSGEFEWGVANWDGSDWSFPGADQITFQRIGALESFDDRVFVATSKPDGLFDFVGDIAMWDGTSWTFLGADLGGGASGISTLDGNLYISGRFSMVAGQQANMLARWDGQQWHSIGSGQSFEVGVRSGVDFLIESGGSLYMSGDFDTVEGQASRNFAIFTPRKELAALPECGVVEDVPPGQFADSETFTVLNSGISDIDIQTIHLEGADSADFNVTPGSDSCTGSTLKADQTCEFQIRFTPSSNGVKRANILVDSDANQGPNPIEFVSSSGVVHFDGFEQSVCQ